MRLTYEPARAPRPTVKSMTQQAFTVSRSSHSVVGGSPFPPIADYGFISDCEVCALVAPSGSVEWMCVPRMDSPSIFAAILDRHAGWWRLGPADVSVPADRRYLAGTMVLETTWDTSTGWVVVRDALLIGPWRDDLASASAHRRVPSDHQAERVLLRTARCLSGSIDIVLECEPAFDYGRASGQWRHDDDRYGHAEVAVDGQPTIRLTSDMNLGFEGPRAMSRRRLRAGEEVFCALSWGDGTPPQTFAEAHGRLSRTADFWHEWIARGRFPDHPWRGYLQRSALTEIGEVDRARALCTKLLAYASPLQLYAEEIDPHSGLHLGNFPQAFTHLALINAVVHLIEEDQRISSAAVLETRPGLEVGSVDAVRTG